MSTDETRTVGETGQGDDHADSGGGGRVGTRAMRRWRSDRGDGGILLSSASGPADSSTRPGGSGLAQFRGTSRTIKHSHRRLPLTLCSPLFPSPSPSLLSAFSVPNFSFLDPHHFSLRRFSRLSLPPSSFLTVDITLDNSSIHQQHQQPPSTVPTTTHSFTSPPLLCFAATQITPCDPSFDYPPSRQPRINLRASHSFSIHQTLPFHHGNLYRFTRPRRLAHTFDPTPRSHILHTLASR